MPKETANKKYILENERIITMNNMNQTNNNNHLNSLEYAGMESLLQRMIDIYENYLGIPEHDRTPAGEISRRTENGIEIFDGEYDLYRIENFAVKGFFPVDDTLVIVGYKLEGREIEDCCDLVPDVMIDVTEFLDEKYIDVDRLIEKVHQI